MSADLEYLDSECFMAAWNQAKGLSLVSCIFVPSNPKVFLSEYSLKLEWLAELSSDSPHVHNRRVYLKCSNLRNFI